MRIIRIVMSALSATIFVRRCVGGVASAFVSQAPRTLLAQSESRIHSQSIRMIFVSSIQHRSFSPQHPFVVRSFVTAMSMSTASTDVATSSLVGIDWVRSSVVDVLNEIFDPSEIAKGAAIAKLDGKKKKKKKKGGDEPAQDEPTMSDEERQAIIDAAVAAAKPFSTMDAMVTPATKPEFGDYQCNAAMSLSKSAGLNPRDCASKIVEGLKSIKGFDDIMEEPEIAGPGFINLRFKDGYLAEAAGKMAGDSEEGGRLAVPKTA
jgi:hypothetical protein